MSTEEKGTSLKLDETCQANKRDETKHAGTGSSQLNAQKERGQPKLIILGIFNN